MKEIVALRPKMYIYLSNDYYFEKKANCTTKKYVIKREIKFQDFNKCL